MIEALERRWSPAALSSSARVSGRSRTIKGWFGLSIIQLCVSVRNTSYDWIL